MEPAAPARNSDPGSWWYLLHTKLYRYRALLRKYWWLVLFTLPSAMRRAIRRARLRRGLCPHCTYDLRGMAADTQCPECGRMRD